MEHISSLPGFLFGLFFVIWFVWNVALGEIALRVGALRFDEKPLLWALFNGFLLTVGTFGLTQSIKGVPALDQLTDFCASFAVQSGWSTFWITYLLSTVISFVLGKITSQSVRNC